MPVAEGKPSQRERIVEAMIHRCAQGSYTSVSIGEVSTLAGVSRSTFYEQFTDKEGCLLAAYQEAVARLVEPMPLQGGEGGWPSTLPNAIGTLLEALARDPDAGRVMLIEARAAGPRLREARERVAETLGARLEGVMNHPPEDSLTLDIPAAPLAGGVRAILVRHLRDFTEEQLPGLAADVLAWLAAYAIADSSPRWSVGPHALLPAGATAEPSRASASARRLPRGRHRLPAGVVARSQRTRIIHGTAEVMLSKGYAEATVADIVAAAGIARDVFYEHFANKQQAFLEAQQHSTQDILDACAAAYFAAEDWPRRVWHCVQTLLAVIAENPALAHLRLVECYAAGTAAVTRAEEITRSFEIFLEEGYHYRPEAGRLPRLCSTAITGAIFDIIQRYVASGATGELPRALPLLAYVAIAPFTGPADAAALIEELSAPVGDCH